jgi:Effector Associated Constant Component 1
MRGDAVQVRVRVADELADESRSLRNWLEDEPDVRRYGQPHRPPGETPPDQMGTGIEVLSLVLGTGLSAAQLVTSIIMWRATRNQPVRVVIEHPGGAVPVDAADPADAPAIAAKIEAS